MDKSYHEKLNAICMLEWQQEKSVEALENVEKRLARVLANEIIGATEEAENLRRALEAVRTAKRALNFSTNPMRHRLLGGK